ncbi:hypothetical protein [Ruegeria atlantica]|nr:hypothetical protein [Ruegeria atlantica]
MMGEITHPTPYTPATLHPCTLPSTHEVQSAIHRVRGARVVLAEDLAQLY